MSQAGPNPEIRIVGMSHRSTPAAAPADPHASAFSPEPCSPGGRSDAITRMIGPGGFPAKVGVPSFGTAAGNGAPDPSFR